ncbi:MAG: serine/threonine-protein kinase [Planctomycetota bacterium]
MKCPCPDDEVLLALIAQKLDKETEADLEKYLCECQRCQDRLESLAEMSAPVIQPSISTTEASDKSIHLLRAIDLLKTDQPTQSSAEIRVELSSKIPPGILEPSDDPDLIGRIAKYDVIDVLGHGGMGIVLKAVDRSLDRVVAIKFLLPEYIVGQSARERFIREAKTAAAIHHPNVVTIYAVEEHKDHSFLVMECVEGETLADRLDRCDLSVDETMSVAVDLLRGLDAAHKLQLVHRDIKPSNVLIQKGTGVAKLSDFGLAKTVDDQQGLTVTGAIAGTPEFMSPEQASSQLPLDARSDLFSLGALLYTILAGESPFRADSTMATLRRVCDDQHKSLASLDTNAPHWFADIVDRLLQKRPSDRFQTAGEVLNAIESNRGNAESAQPSESNQGRLLLAGIGIIALIAIAGFGLWDQQNSDSSKSGSQADEVILETSAAPRVEALSPIKEPGFYVDDKTQYGTLGEAVSAAKDKAVILVHGDQEFLLDDHLLIDKSLTIRAAKGSVPVFVAQTQGLRPVISTQSELRIEGCQFRCKSEVTAMMSLRRCMLSCRGGSLRISNCAFEMEGTNGCVGTDGAAFLSNCRFDCVDGSGVLISPSRTKLCQIQNCQFKGRSGVSIAAQTDLLKPATLEISGCLFQTETAIHILDVQTSMPSLKIASTDNDFDVGDHVFGRSNMRESAGLSEAIEDTTRQFAWILDRGNRFQAKASFFFLGRRRGRSAYRIGTQTKWEEMLGIESQSKIGFDGREPQVAHPEWLGPGTPYDLWKESHAESPLSFDR